jgi:hypothetical protein
VLYQHHHCHVTQPLLCEQLREWGVEISSGQVNALLQVGDGPCRDINFDPLVLPAGMVASDDPLLAARSAVYPESFRRRVTEEARARQGDRHYAALKEWVAVMKSWIDPDQSHGVRHDDRAFAPE